jgi:hypothetical protein
MVRIEGDAYRGGDLDAPPLQLEGLAQGRDQPARQRRAIGFGDAAFHQQQELVAADPGHGVALARVAAQSVRSLLQHDVTHAVAVGIVDGLEAVQVDEQDGEPFLVALRHPVVRALGARHGMGQAVLEKLAVGQLGQRIHERAAPQLLVRFVKLRIRQPQRLRQRIRLGLKAGAEDKDQPGRRQQGQRGQPGQRAEVGPGQNACAHHDGADRPPGDGEGAAARAHPPGEVQRHVRRETRDQDGRGEGPEVVAAEGERHAAPGAGEPARPFGHYRPPAPGPELRVRDVAHIPNEKGRTQGPDQLFMPDSSEVHPPAAPTR